MYFGFWPFFVLYVLKFEIKKEKVSTLNGIPGSVLGFLGVEKKCYSLIWKEMLSFGV